VSGQGDRRRSAREFAARAIERGEPLAWFEELYAAAQRGAATVPWADLAPCPQLEDWLDGRLDLPPARAHTRALVVGCGFGDDAALLARRGHRVVAFDVAPTAIERARERFAHLCPVLDVQWCAADLLALPSDFAGAFELVVEVNTLQVLPRSLRDTASAALARALAPGGQLFLAARARRSDEPEGAMPWPLLAEEVEAFAAHGLVRRGHLVLLDAEEPPVRRHVALFERP